MDPVKPAGVFLNADDIARLRRNAATDWGRRIVARLEGRARELARGRAPIPNLDARWMHPRSGNIHDFISPLSSWWIVYDPRGPEQSRDPVYGTPIEPGARGLTSAEEAWRWVGHHLLFQHLRAMGVYHVLCGDDAVRAWLREALLIYADKSRRHHEELGDEEFLFFSALYDAKFLLAVSWAYDTIGGGDAFSDADRERVLRYVFELPADGLMHRLRFKEGRPHPPHNFLTYANAAVAAAAVILGRDEWLERTCSDEAGLLKCLDAITPGGMWAEDTLSYHWYTVTSLQEHLEILRHKAHPTGARQDVEEGLRRLYLFPLSLSDPSGRMTVFGDAWRPNDLGSQSYQYEYAHYRFGSPFGEVLSWIYDRGLAERASLEALLYGRDPLPPHRSPCAIPAGDPGASGITRLLPLEEGTGVCVWLKHGPRPWGHMHRDILGISLHVGDVPVSSDLISYGYYQPRFGKKWYERTVNHNTIVIDEQSQGRVNGCRISLERVPGAVWAVAEAEPYEGVLHRRAAAIVDGRIVVVLDEVTCAFPRLVDWVYRALGVVVPNAGATGDPARGRAPRGDEYAEFELAASLGGRTMLQALWLCTNRLALAGTFASDAPADAHFGSLPGNPAAVREGTVVLRRGTDRARFAAVLEPLPLRSGDPLFDHDYMVLTADQWRQCEDAAFHGDELVVRLRDRTFSFRLDSRGLVFSRGG